MKILNIGGELQSDCNQVTNKGLTKALKNKIYLNGQTDISKVIQEHPKSRPVVGQLPNYIFKKLPLECKKEAISAILDAFDNITFTIRDFVPTNLEEIRTNRPEFINDILTEVFRKYNVISKTDSINVKYINKGDRGQVFKLEGLRDIENEDEYVIKIFHAVKNPSWEKTPSHGCYAEINSGLYWKTQAGQDTQRGKFFFASLESGYIFSKYIDEDIRLPKKIIPESKYGILCTNEDKSGAVVGYNRTKGYNYDYGGMKVVNPLLNSDKIIRAYHNRIEQLETFEREKYWLNEFNKPKNSERKYAGLAMAINYLNNKARFINMCKELNLPIVNQALNYVNFCK